VGSVDLDVLRSERRLGAWVWHILVSCKRMFEQLELRSMPFFVHYLIAYTVGRAGLLGCTLYCNLQPLSVHVQEHIVPSYVNSRKYVFRRSLLVPDTVRRRRTALKVEEVPSTCPGLGPNLARAVIEAPTLNLRAPHTDLAHLGQPACHHHTRADSCVAMTNSVS
jgi:hypothetical protein